MRSRFTAGSTIQACSAYWNSLKTKSKDIRISRYFLFCTRLCPATILLTSLTHTFSTVYPLAFAPQIRVLDTGESRARYHKILVTIDGPVTTHPPTTSLFVNSRTLMGCAGRPSKRGGSARLISVLSGSVASYLCRFMLTCGCTFR